MRKLRERREDKQDIPELEPRSIRLLYFPISRLVHALASTRHHRTDGYYLRFHVRCLMSTSLPSFITFRHISRTECLAPFTASGGSYRINVITLASPSSYSQLPSFQRGFEASSIDTSVWCHGLTGLSSFFTNGALPSHTYPFSILLVTSTSGSHALQSCIYVPSENPEQLPN